MSTQEQDQRAAFKCGLNEVIEELGRRPEDAPLSETLYDLKDLCERILDRMNKKDTE